jgi:hypothetical protein
MGGICSSSIYSMKQYGCGHKQENKATRLALKELEPVLQPRKMAGTAPGASKHESTKRRREEEGEEEEEELTPARLHYHRTTGGKKTKHQVDMSGDVTPLDVEGGSMPQDLSRNNFARHILIAERERGLGRAYERVKRFGTHPMEEGPSGPTLPEPKPAPPKGRR